MRSIHLPLLAIAVCCVSALETETGTEVATAEGTTGPLYNGMLRIVPSGSNPLRGRLEVLWNYRWGTVCTDFFGNANARVACRQMNFPDGWLVGSYMRPTCASLDGRYACANHYTPMWLDDVRCSGNEDRLMDCGHLPWGWHNCSHYWDVSIQCRSPPLWNIEYEFNDEPDTNALVSGVVAHYTLYLTSRSTPNFWVKCHPKWKADEKVLVMKYESGSLTDTPHLEGTLTGEAFTTTGVPYIHFDAKAAHCDLDKLRAVQCDKDFEIPIDARLSSCWESNPRPPPNLALVQPEVPYTTADPGASGAIARNTSSLSVPPSPEAVRIAHDTMTSVADTATVLASLGISGV